MPLLSSPQGRFRAIRMDNRGAGRSDVSPEPHMPNAQLVMLTHASHTFFTDQLEAATGAVLSFLEESRGLTSTASRREAIH